MAPSRADPPPVQAGERRGAAMAARRDRPDPTASPRNGVVDDPADGWFPESVAATYDAPGGANAPEAVLPALQLLEALADGGPVL